VRRGPSVGGLSAICWRLHRELSSIPICESSSAINRTSISFFSVAGSDATHAATALRLAGTDLVRGLALTRDRDQVRVNAEKIGQT